MTAADRTLRPWKVVYMDALTFISPGILTGLLCGAVIGGVGGRLAMFILRVTSSDSLQGMKTDDDFTIGSFTGETAFLVIITASLGAIGGLVYIAVRQWLPARWRPVLFGLLGGTFGGAAVIRPDGVDFTALEPLWGAVALFVLLPAVYGAILSALTERLVRSTGFQRSLWRWAAIPPLLFVLFTGPEGVGLLLLIGLLIGVDRSGHLAQLWTSTPVTWLGRGAFATALAASSVFLVSDVSAVL